MTTGRNWNDRYCLAIAKSGTKFFARNSLRAIGLYPVENRGALYFRRVGPQPEATIVLGMVDVEVIGLKLIFVDPHDKAVVEPIEVFVNGEPVVEPIIQCDSGETFWSIEIVFDEVRDPSVTLRLQLRFSRSFVEDARNCRVAGPALYSIECLGSRKA